MKLESCCDKCLGKDICFHVGKVNTILYDIREQENDDDEIFTFELTIRCRKQIKGGS